MVLRHAVDAGPHEAREDEGTDPPGRADNARRQQQSEIGTDEQEISGQGELVPHGDRRADDQREQ